MSKQRSISIRRSDETIIQAFEVALAQVGVFFTERHKPYNYITIEGNKEEGKVTVKTATNEASVYLYGGGEVFINVDHVVFDVLDGLKLDLPKFVQIHNFDKKDRGSNMVNLLNLNMQHRSAVVYQVATTVYGAIFAESVLDYLWKYPRVEVEGELYKITYEYVDSVSNVKKIELWYDKNFGYVRAAVDEKYYLTSEKFSNTLKLDTKVQE